MIDTGIDLDSPEFAGRIHPDSQDVAGGGRTAEQEDDHGTNVALVAAAARDNLGVLGIAFDATVLALRADTPGSCGAEDPSDPSLDCFFEDPAIAAGIDQAVASGAAVVNLSLGGGAATQPVIDAVERAVAAGVVVIVAAGNDGEGGFGINPNQPDPFAQSLADAGPGGVIIVGSVDEGGNFSSFSNRAGRYRDVYISARGETICCTYEDGELFVDDEGFIYLFSGTSFAAPQVAGAVALLAQAFPTLTGQEIVEILLNSAFDVGAVGADRVYGTGILDIAAAFAPSGTTTLAGTTAAIPLGDTSAVGSTAMGDALVGQSLQAVVHDKYKRAYNVDFVGTMRGADVAERLNGAVGAQTRHVSLGGSQASMAFTISASDQDRQPWVGALKLTEEDAQAARVMAARVALKLSPDTQVGFAFAEGSDGLVAQMQGHERPAFMIARSATGDDGVLRTSDFAVAARRQLGDWGLSVNADGGQIVSGSQLRLAADGFDRRQQDRARSVGIALDREFGGLETALGLTWMAEDRTILGGRFHEAFGGGGANTLFLDAQAGWDLADGWRAAGAFRQGWTMAEQAGFVTDGSRLSAQAWSFDVTRNGVFAANDRMGFRVAQPLRVESGTLALNLPVAYSYDTLQTDYGIRTLNLAPEGREIMGELSWQGRLFNGSAIASLYYRRQPGHYTTLPDDQGVAVRWSAEF